MFYLGKKKWEKQQLEDAKDEESRQKRADELKRQRSQEAKQLIGQRSTEARAVFERHSSQVKNKTKRLIHLLFTEIFCTMGYRNFCSKASVQKFL